MTKNIYLVKCVCACMNAYDRDDNIVHMSCKYINMDRVCNCEPFIDARIFVCTEFLFIFDANVKLMSTDVFQEMIFLSTF